MFPGDNAWNRDVSADQVDPHSVDYLAFMGAGSLNLHPDFGAPEYGQPFWALNGTQDPRWPTLDLEQLKSIPASAFEVVKLGPVVRGL
jgi:hypothetical protein